MAIECPKCHTENTSDSEFCKKCATPLPTSEEVLASPTKTLETPVKDLTKGTTFLGRFEVIEELGKGGMGQVYRVFDRTIKEEVALKLLKPEISGDENIIERFTNELKFARKIIHKNVCRMYDISEEEGKYFITMEYVPGEDLKSLIRRESQLSVGQAVSIAKQIGEGLSEAHRLGVIHRDLKPSNIMIDEEGNAHIMDFGIARSLKSEGITREGVMIGTPEYISPEQVEGKEADQRSDVYSLGIILYEMVAGRVPFEGDTTLSVALMHKTETPKDPREFNDQIPENLSRLILKLMEKKKDDRYQTSDELLEGLKKLKIERAETTFKGKLAKILFMQIRLTKRRRAAGLRKKLLKFSLRGFIALLIIYGIISVISFINDYVYGVKLDKIGIEYDTYYKNLFPIKKDWLPAGWEDRECNSYLTYAQLFPPKGTYNEYTKEFREVAKIRPLREFYGRRNYAGVQELKNFVEKYRESNVCNELSNAVKCSEIDSYQLIQNDQVFDILLIFDYVRMIILDARVDFMEGNHERCLAKIIDAMLLALDLNASTDWQEMDQAAVTLFKMVYQELISYFLSGELNYNLDVIKHIEELISFTVTKTDYESSIYKEYLWLGRYHETNPWMYCYFTKSEYNFLGKLYYGKSGFSWKRGFYKERIEFLLGLFEGLKYIRNYRDKSIYIMDYFDKYSTVDQMIIFLSGSPSFTDSFRYNISRMLGKLALAVLTIKKYGMNSPEFSELRGTEFFINELSGKGFEIVEKDSEAFIVVDKEYRLSLKRIDYIKDHKQLLQSFKHFDFVSAEHVQKLFYSFDLE